jgi:hypothetical protein
MLAVLTGASLGAAGRAAGFLALGAARRPGARFAGFFAAAFLRAAGRVAGAFLRWGVAFFLVAIYDLPAGAPPD